MKRRTKELDVSNRQLALANEKLKLHDKMQEEFINIAAHELRTPIQPIIGLSEVLETIKDWVNDLGKYNVEELSPMLLS